jgi:hypothetical protein
LLRTHPPGGGNEHRSVEYMIVGFPGNQFNGEDRPALADLI